MNIEGTTFIVPSEWSYDGSKPSRSFQNVRIIQNDGIVLQESTPAPTQEQIMQAEILYEAPPSTPEASLMIFELLICCGVLMR